MKKIILFFVALLIALLVVLFILDKSGYPVLGFMRRKVVCVKPLRKEARVGKALEFLRIRKDSQAEALLDEVLVSEPVNLDALWGKAEIFRRKYDYKNAQIFLRKVLKVNPKYYPARISLAYIQFRANEFNDAQKTIEDVLNEDCVDQDTQALSYVLLGNIFSTRSAKGNLMDKMRFTPLVKPYLDKGAEISPNLSEVHLGLGSFYLLAPALIGGSIDKAIEELEKAHKLAPDFATVNVRLAQAYEIKGDKTKFEFYLRRAEELEPNNEMLIEFMQTKK
ncbi:MAG: tetratricopeptide repeat protein [Candidatus Omnitrophica bacterium]|nr:tetratricopeptide repeat protein [Candidatus Omnitrophota bacterium]